MVNRALLLVVSLALPATALARDDSVGRIVAASGSVFVTRGDDARVAAHRGEYLEEGDVITTGDPGSVRLLMSDKSVLALAANSSIKISAYAVDPVVKRRKASLTVMLGRLWAFVSRTDNPEASYEVRTETAVAGVRGTELVFDVGAGGDSAVTVIKGEVELGAGADGSGGQTVGARQSGSVGGAGEIALASASDEEIAAIKETVEPEQVLDREKAAERAEATRRETGKPTPDGVERAESGSGNALFEDLESGQSSSDGNDRGAAAPSEGTNSGEYGDLGGGTTGGEEPMDNAGPIITAPALDFDPFTMALVRLRVEVRE